MAKLDEEYIARMEDVLDVYEKPLNFREPVVCLDEKPIQLLKNISPTSRIPKPGKLGRKDYEYKRKGTSKIRFSNKAISAAGGLVFFQDLIEKTYLSGHLEAALPKPKIKTKSSSFDKFKAMILGLVQGAECLDDMARCQADPVFQELSEHHLTPTSYGNFLRSFDKPMISKLGKSLMKHSFELHRKLNPSGPLVFDIDSSSHLQHGMKMEGLSINYLGNRGLDSLEVFDQFGLAYHLNVREGATFTAQNAPFVIEELGRVTNKSTKNNDRIVRADSGFSNNQVFEACEHAGFDP